MTPLDQLKDTPLFSGLTDEDLSLLEPIVEARQCSNGELLFTHGTNAQNLLVVVSGQIQLELPVSILGESKNIPFETKGSGEAVGWSALVPPYRFTLTGRVRGEASVAVLPRAELIALFDEHPTVGYRFMRNLASVVGERLHHTQAMWAREVQRSLDVRYR